MTVFEAYITNLGKYAEGQLVGETLKFPATTEEVQSLLKNIGVDGVRYEEFFITAFDGDVMGLYDYLTEYENLDELNHLAHLISELDSDEIETLEAALNKGDHTSSVADIINLVHNLDCYELHPGVTDDETLGRIYVEDMELLDVPDNVLPYFDFEAYGRDMRINEGGHFAPTGYLTRSGDFKEVYHGIEDIPAEHRIFAYPKLNIREQMAAYCGDVINFKSYSKSYKMKKRIENPEENRAIFLNVHEAIIDRQTWEKVQALQKGTRRKKTAVTQAPSVFSGLLKCPECGGNLNFHFNQNNHDIKFFSCQNHNSGYRKCSKTHYIRLDFLEQVVLYEVKRLACFASEYENDFIKAMIGRSAKVAENTALRKQRELDALTARDRELDMLFERLYEDNVAGKIDDARFAKMSKRYEQEQGENAKKIKALRLELKKDESKRMDIDDFLETVRRYTDATTITKRMVAELIDHIEVYHAEKQDGVTNQRVVIYYNCIGAFDVPDRRKIPEADIIMETRKGVALSYAPEQVAV